MFPLRLSIYCLLSCLLTSPAFAQSNSLKLEQAILHLDARSLDSLGDQAKVSTWRNGVEGIGSLNQEASESQPRLKKIGDSFVVRFNGLDQQLRCEGNNQRVRELTLFVVAAPHSNFGDFRGILSANAKDQRDYTTGFCLDFGPAASRKLDWVNVEGNGFTTAADLCDSTHEFGQLKFFTVRISETDQEVLLRIDGSLAGKRKYAPTTISLEEWTVGARYVSDGPGEMPVLNAFEGDIAEIVLFDKSLDDSTITEIESHLTSKHAQLAELLPQEFAKSSNSAVLEKVTNPAPVQMLVPGFEMHELPVELTNVNNVRYRHDGTLVTLGYNGDIHLLTDSDGDGLEDQAKPFWKNQGSLRGPIGMYLTPKGYPKGQGVFTPSKGKLSLIVDTNGDDQADEELVIASGWNEITQNVDATGVTMDAEGNLYFGLGTANFANAYLLDDQGKSQYDIHSDRGTVQRLSADFSKRETICTGIRFPIAFAFNHLGDLFCTEQEGATWLPNGNPFDELLHIVPNKHYGFPPRHPRYNPGVIDEPSVFDYAPQHQSTCGMVFNEGVHGGPVFGPAWWKNQAIVCGESRGKIWRTQLCKSEHGYLAQSQLLACLQMLTVDACVAPNGDLIVACHSGPPDWGTGPTGIGKLYRIKMSDLSVPRPVLAFANSRQEIVIAFDQPVPPEALQGVLEQVRIYYGDYVRAGDRFENLNPPYAVVARQNHSPRKQLSVRGLSLSNDRRLLLIQTDAMQQSTSYAISLPWKTQSSPSTADPTMLSVLEVDMTLDGVWAQLVSSQDTTDGAELWTGWLPHLDSIVNQEFTQHSRPHEEYQKALEAARLLKLSTKLDLSQVLRPAVQPGSKIDYEWPAEIATFWIHANHPFTLDVSGQRWHSKINANSQYEITYAVPPEMAKSLEIELNFTLADEKKLVCSTAVYTNEDPTPRPISLTRLKLPWAVDHVQEEVHEPRAIAEIEGGSWGRGRRVFHSDAASCFKCHAIHGSGSQIGPDLTNLVHRDYASVLRDIRNPSFAINPDHLGQVILTHDDQILTGVLRTEQGQLILGDANGNSHRIPRDSIAEIKPAEVSIMPKGLDERLTKEQLRDLMTFLLEPPPSMPLDSPLKAPPVRTPAEVAAVLAGATPVQEPIDTMHVVLVSGDKDHGPGEHDYPAWQRQWLQLLDSGKEVDVQTAHGFPSDDQLERAHVLVFFQKGAWNDDRQKKMDRYFEQGKGAVYIHWAVNGDDRVADFSKRIGLASHGGNIRFRHGPLSLAVHNTDHPIMRNIEPLQLYDESYWLLTGDPGNVTLFATSDEDGAAQPQMWSYERGQGRVFVSIPGHYSWTFDDPIFRTILLRGIAWTAKQPVDRLNDLVPLGARMSR